jgi:hypothetical protein
MRAAAVIKLWKRFRDRETNVKGQNHLFHCPPEACGKRSAARFRGSGWCIVRSISLAKGGTLKKGPSPHLHKVPTRRNKVGPRTFQMALVQPVGYLSYSFNLLIE